MTPRTTTAALLACLGLAASATAAAWLPAGPVTPLPLPSPDAKAAKPLATTTISDDLLPAPEAAAPWLGVGVSEMDANGDAAQPGLVVTAVVPGSPAEAAGLQVDDVLVRLNDQLLFSPAQLTGLLAMHDATADVELEVQRKGRTLPLTVTLAPRPANLPQLAPPVPDAPQAQPAQPGQWRDAPAPGGLNLRWRMDDGLRESLGQMLRQFGGQLDQADLDQLLQGAPMELPPDLQQQLERAQAQLQQHLQQMQQQLQGDDLAGMMQELQQGLGGLQQFQQEGLPELQQQLQEQLQQMLQGENGRPALPEGLRERLQDFGASNMSVVSMSDGEHTLVLTTRDGDRSLRATTQDGKLVFEGPVNTDDELNNVPDDVRAKLDAMLNNQPQQAPAPPAPRRERNTA